MERCWKVTGILRNGKRFKAIKTRNQMHAYGINLWRGTKWESEDGGKTWKVWYRVWN